MAEPTPPPPTDADPEATLPRMTLGEHLDELRRRVGRSVLAVVIATIAAVCFNDALWTQAVAPYNEAMAGAGASGSLQTLSPLDGFIQPFKLAFIVAIVVSSPYVLWQMWGFIAAGLYVHEKKAVRVFFPASLVLFAAGVATAFLVVLPVGLRFLIGFGQSHGWAAASRWGVPSLGLSLLFGLGIAYQLPIVMVFLQAMGIVERETLRRAGASGPHGVRARHGPHAGPSPVSQTIMAGPLVGLYFLGVWAGRLSASTASVLRPARVAALVAVLALVALFVTAATFATGAVGRASLRARACPRARRPRSRRPRPAVPAPGAPK
jgi:sec-independent protein translocase protein TatC